MFQKKSHPVKIKINYYAQVLKNQKKKKKNRKKRGNVNAQEKKSDNWQCDCPEKEKEKAKNKKGATLLLEKKMIMMSLNLRGVYLIYNDVETVWLVDPLPYLQGSHDVYFTDDMAAVSTPTLLLTYAMCYLWKIVPSVAYKLR